ncbi:hypothetical protein BV20DRAFT_1058508 [Pilatotrama ljubarskyi]|nr:hypothetical protein BV20DRAFT_1058508 [Pilatotrama ljubarskyi]
MAKDDLYATADQEERDAAVDARTLRAETISWSDAPEAAPEHNFVPPRFRRRQILEQCGSDADVPPPTTDEEGLSSLGHASDYDGALEVDEELNSLPGASKPTATAISKSQLARERKLNDELPVITAISKREQDGPAGVQSAPYTTWLPRTDIDAGLQKARGRKWEILLKPLGPEMRSVLTTSFATGSFRLVFGNKVTDEGPEDRVRVMQSPMAALGMERLAIEALIEAAESLGFGGEGDVAHRLEDGDTERYVAPLREYTAHRLRLTRNAIKKAAAGTLPAALKITSRAADEVKSLLTGSNYIYPCSETGLFDKSKPFSGDGIADVVRAAFFSKQQYLHEGLDHVDSLRSSLPTAPSEREVPISMVALAACAVEAFLIDYAGLGRASGEFASAGLDNSYKAHVVLLQRMCEKRPVVYHCLMHKILRDATNGIALYEATGSLSQEQMLAEVDWDAMPME